MRRAADLDPDEPLTLQEACDIIFRGIITPSTLRAERERGNLVFERIGRKDFVTLRAINEMRERSRRSARNRAPLAAADLPKGDYATLVAMRRKGSGC